MSSQKTINLNLHKWIGTDNVKRIEFNENWDTIDTQVKTVNDSINTHNADYVKHPGYGATTGSLNTYALALSPPPSSYVDGMAVSIKINADNTGASTINLNSLGAKSIKKANGTDVGSGNLKAGSIYTLRYNSTTGNFILQGEGGDLSDTDKANFIIAANNILGS